MLTWLKTVDPPKLGRFTTAACVAWVVGAARELTAAWGTLKHGSAGIPSENRKGAHD